MKTRNGIVFSPHPRTKKSTAYTAKLVLDAAVAAGAPRNIIGCIDEPTLALSHALMHHNGIDLILATGGPAMVKAAYSSAKPAIGVGAGNTPVVIDETADIKRAVSSILMSKTFDNGVVCASEQSCIVVDSIYDQVKERFIKYGGYFLDTEEADKVRKLLFINGALNAKIVGQSALKIAELAGITVPPYTKVLIGEGEVLSDKDEFAHEKLSPTLGFYRARDFEDAVEMAVTAVAMGGVGVSLSNSNHLACSAIVCFLTLFSLSAAYFLSLHEPRQERRSNQPFRQEHEDRSYLVEHTNISWRYR